MQTQSLSVPAIAAFATLTLALASLWLSRACHSPRAVGLAHIGGGPVYAMLASVAGAGYGWVYASSRSLSAAIATHAGLNTIHLFCFTYPSLLSI